MGLFYTSIGAEVRGLNAPKPGRRKIAIAPQSAARLSCTQCPLDHAPLASPKMLPTGAAQPLIYILGEAPGRTEDEQGRQFVGASGNLVRDLLPASWDDLIRWNNTIRCRPPKNRDPEGIEIACCRHLQVEDIERSKPAAIIGFGNVPLRWMLGDDRQISVWRGRRMPVRVGSHQCWFYPITHPSAILRGMNDRKKGEALRACFERDVLRVLNDLSAGLPPADVETDFFAGVECLEEYGAAGLAQIEERLAHWTHQDHGIDIETNGLRPYRPDARILTVAVGTYNSVFAFGWHHRETRWTPRERSRIGEIVEAYLLGVGIKWAHSARFEQEWFHAIYGPRVLYETQWGDTLGQAHILDERNKGKALDDLTQLHFGFRVKSLSNVDVAHLDTEPLSDVLPYNALDSKYCHALSIVQAEALEAAGLTTVYGDRNTATASLVCMQAKGVVRNLPAIEELDKSLSLEEEKIKLQIYNEQDVAAYRNRGATLKPGSPESVVKFFRDYLKIEPPRRGRQDDEDSYSVDEEALSQIDHPVASMVLDLRTVVKNRGYVTPLKERGKYVHADGLVHASYSQYVAVSGRLACEDPNQQNYPRRLHKEIRRVVGCPPGHRLVAFDYGQLEARVVAAVANDLNLKAEIFNGQDIHGDWTDAIGGRFVPRQLKKDRKKVRDSIKQYWTFANFYGNLLEAVAHDLSHEFDVQITPLALAPYFEEFWDRYHGVAEWQEGLMERYWDRGWVQTATGQRRHEPMSRNEIINHPIQGTAGHLVIDAQARISRMAYELDKPALQPIMNIHDDLSFYLPNKGMEDYIETIGRTMVLTPFDFITVPLMVEISIGDNWCDKEEIGKISSEDYACLTN